MRVLDLFSGIGGFSLGLERAGMRTVAFCEIEPYCRAVLAKHWPGVPIYTDVRELNADRLAADGIGVDVICGGFPCQDISVAGKGAGLAGERSGLWREYARLISELRPSYVVVENVAALLSRGLGEVLGDLAALGYDAEWHCIPASHVGAPHRRDRVWIIANSDRIGGGQEQVSEFGRRDKAIAWNDGKTQSLANSESGEGGRLQLEGVAPNAASGGSDVADPARQLLNRSRASGTSGWTKSSDGGWWASEPDVGRVANGVPSRVDRLRALGNAVVPQIPEIIGRAIMRCAR